MKKIFFITLFSLFLSLSLQAAPSGGNSGGNSGSGSGGNSGSGSAGNSGSGSAASSGRDGPDGNYSHSTGYDKELKRILFEIEKKENYEGALKDLEIYVYENPQNANGWNLIGFASRKLERYDDSEIYYSTGLEIDPKHEGILSYQGELFLKTDRYEDALVNLDVLTELCKFNCTEKQALAEAITIYEQENNL